MEEEEETNYKKRMGDQWVKDLAKFGTNWVKPYLTEAPYIVLLFKQTYGLNEDGSRKTHYYNEISCSVAAGKGDCDKNYALLLPIRLYLRCWVQKVQL